MNFISVDANNLHMVEKYKVTLTEKDAEFLKKLTTSGEAKARTFKRAMILLAFNDGKPYENVMSSLGVSETMVFNTKKNYCTRGLEGALFEKPRPGQPKKVTPDVEAKLVALACEEPPTGRNSWTISLLTNELESRFSIDLGWGTIQRTLAENQQKPWKKRCGVFPT
nr:helix-turn-helix domain-containing protein [Candidatus Sigynarchaeota archaeon]